MALSYAPTRFLPALEGLRGIAALGILSTHVAFQTGTTSALLARFDFFVALFFALSAFVLWRNYALLSPQKLTNSATISSYYKRRFRRIVPAYLICVVLVLAFFPVAFGISWQSALAQVFMLQIYLPNGLVGGLTHLWSLGVEVAFYLVLPLLVVLLRRFPRTWHLPLLFIPVLIGFSWPWWPLVAENNTAVNLQIWPISYAPWFFVGLATAELSAHRIPSILRRWASCPGTIISWILALVVAWIAGQEWFGPLGLQHPSPAEFNLRILAGTIFAALFLVPVAVGEIAGIDSWIVKCLSSWPLRTLGKWSYSLFLWHVAILSWAFPVLGIKEFQGHFLMAWLFTVIVSIAAAFISYELAEKPAKY
ncbi:acyltransferase family protein [Corynebacterium caspium]|uniref:acyltransferase family protein n=1 Tax=Corynebacterium caspium TaxID=234828 RepID=UPI0003797FC6|nr:acyltransferase [Corynebacterium caspium]WKD59955.1 O-acetyltransferase OatA [Corynebacterium caspium DSM 44850]